MQKLIKLECYIEEYRNQKILLLRFLSQAKLNQDIMPTIYEQNGKDKIIVCGYIVSSTKESIKICIDIENGGYLFA